MRRLLAIIVIGVAAMSSAAFAQPSAGRISGLVVDQTQSPFPGVIITARTDNQQITVVAATTGAFVLSNLRPGSYVVIVEQRGFHTERRRIEVRAGETHAVNFTLRAGCAADTTSLTDRQPLVDPRISARSDLVAYLRIEEERIDEDSSSDPDCRTRYKATLLGSVKRSSFNRPAGGTIDVFLNSRPAIEVGQEYVIWLTWRSDKNAFDSGADIETLVRPVIGGRVNPLRGPCLALPSSPPDLCPQTYSVEELFHMYQGVFDR